LKQLSTVCRTVTGKDPERTRLGRFFGCSGEGDYANILRLACHWCSQATRITLRMKTKDIPVPSK